MKFLMLIKVCLCFAVLLWGSFASNANASAPQYLKDRYANGDSHAAYIIGNRYRLGVDGDKDNSLAKSWYEKAANEGVIEAQFTLAWMATSPNETPDYQAAIKWAVMAEANPDNSNKAQQEAFVAAKRYLSRFCRRGYADFPTDHAYANDPKCWLARGEYLYKNRVSADSGQEALSDLKSTHYTERTKAYLIKALDAGKYSAAETLAQIEAQGWGGPKNAEKAKQYLILEKTDERGKVFYRTATNAWDAKNINEYLDNLTLGAAANDESSARALGYEYLNAKRVEKNDRLGLMYLILGRSRRPFQFTGRNQRHLDAYVPFVFDAPPVLVLFRDEATPRLLEASYQDALTFAAANKFDAESIAEVTEMYDYAMAAFNYFHPRGAVWYSSNYWFVMFHLIAPFVGLNIFGFFIWLFLRKNGARINWPKWEW